MGFLRWCGYIVAAIIATTIILSVGFAVLGVMAVASAVVLFGGIVFLIAASIKASVEGRRR